MKRIIFFALASLLLALPVAADVPNTLNIQGVLMDETGSPLPDGDYYVAFDFWDAATSGNMVWSETTLAHQVGGVFNAILGSGEEFYPETFSQPLWLRMTIDGEDPTEPLIPMTSVATALRAWSVDPGAAVRSLNGMTDSVTLIGGANVTITPSGSTLTISAVAGAGGDDGDWVISGEDISHTPGTVFVGLDAPAAKADGIPPRRDGDDNQRDPSSAKMMVLGINEGLTSFLIDDDDLADGRSAIFARRYRSVRNDGTGFADNQTNTAITGYNDWGDSYTFGVAGYTWFDFSYTGGVLGSNNTGDIWSSLAYRDGNGFYWGMYTPNSLHVGQLTRTFALQVLEGASSGYILTSDSSGNASWQPPSAAQSDGDWTINGDDLFHDGGGTVAIGTSNPIPILDHPYSTTLQVSAYSLPALCLDHTAGGFDRWAIYNAGNRLQFGYTESATSTPSVSMQINEYSTYIMDQNGAKRIALQGYDGDMETGGMIKLYGANTNDYPTLVLDGHEGTSSGGKITARNGSGNTQVTITGNHDNSNIGRVITPVLEITGGSDLSEQFDIGNTSLLLEPGMVVSIDPDHPGQLTLCENSYDRRVAGVISGAGGVNTGMLMGQSGSDADGEHPVALVGRVYVWADASNGPIEPGDLLTSSDRPGHAMKVEDHSRAMGAILGKAMTGLSEGQGLILTLVSLQ